MPGTGRTVRAAIAAGLLTVAVLAVAVLAVGCGGAPPSPARPGPATPAAATPATTAPAAKITKQRACRLLRADLARNHGVPDLPTLRRIADHVDAAPRLAADARTAVRDIDHTGVAPLALALLRDECARAGVPIPVP